ncbi:hypothetical protein NFJ02_30g76720 [Pycnococcus provasolii]
MVAVAAGVAPLALREREDTARTSASALSDNDAKHIPKSRLVEALRALRGWLDTPRNLVSVQGVFVAAQKAEYAKLLEEHRVREEVYQKLTPRSQADNASQAASTTTTPRHHVPPTPPAAVSALALVENIATLAAGEPDLRQLWEPNAALLAEALVEYAGKKNADDLLDMNEFARAIAKACESGWGRKATVYSDHTPLVQRLGFKPPTSDFGRSFVVGWSKSTAALAPSTTGFRHTEHNHRRIPKSEWKAATFGLHGGAPDHPATSLGYATSVRAPSHSFGGADGVNKLTMAPAESLVHQRAGLAGRPKIGWHGLDPCFSSGRESGAAYLHPETAPGVHNLNHGAHTAKLRTLTKSPHWSINSRDLRVKVFRPIKDVSTGGEWTGARSGAEVSGFTLNTEENATPGPDHYRPGKLPFGALPGTSMPRGALAETHPRSLVMTAGRAADGLSANLTEPENVGRTIGLPFTGTKAMGVNWDAATMYQFNGVPGPGTLYGPKEYANRVANWQTANAGRAANEAPAASLHIRPAPHETLIVQDQLVSKSGLHLSTGGLHISSQKAPGAGDYQERQLRSGGATSIADEAMRPGNRPTMEPRRHPGGLVPTQLPIAGGHMPESNLFAPCPGEYGERLGVNVHSLERQAAKYRDDPSRMWQRADAFPGTTPLRLGVAIPEEATATRMAEGVPHPSAEMGYGRRFDPRGVRAYATAYGDGEANPVGPEGGPQSYFPTHATSGDAAERTGFAESLRDAGSYAALGIGAGETLRGFQTVYDPLGKPELSLLNRTAPVVSDALRSERAMV